MLSEATDLKVRLVMLAIREKRLRGEIGDDEAVSTETMAKISDQIGFPVSERTFRRVEQIAIARLRATHASPKSLS